MKQKEWTHKPRSMALHVKSSMDKIFSKSEIKYIQGLMNRDKTHPTRIFLHEATGFVNSPRVVRRIKKRQQSHVEDFLPGAIVIDKTQRNKYAGMRGKVKIDHYWGAVPENSYGFRLSTRLWSKTVPVKDPSEIKIPPLKHSPGVLRASEYMQRVHNFDKSNADIVEISRIMKKDPMVEKILMNKVSEKQLKSLNLLTVGDN